MVDETTPERPEAEAGERAPRKRDQGRSGSVVPPKRGGPLLTLDEAARRHGLSRYTLNRAALSGKLAEYGEVVRVGYQWLVTDAAVTAWVEGAGHRPGPAPGAGPKRKKADGEGKG